MRVLGIVLLVLLAGCQSEPDFDERYDAVEEDIRKTAREIDQELDNRSGRHRETQETDEAAGDPGGGATAS